MKNSVMIRKAKQVLIEDGWRRGHMGYGNAPHCVLGAFRKAAGGVIHANNEQGVYESVPAAQAFARCVRADVPSSLRSNDTVRNLIRWNDRWVKTPGQVIEALERCAQIEEGEGR